MSEFAEMLCECISFTLIICGSTVFVLQKTSQRPVGKTNAGQSPNRTKPLHSPGPMEGAGMFWFLISAFLPFGLIAFEGILKELMLCYKSYWVSRVI